MPLANVCRHADHVADRPGISGAVWIGRVGPVGVPVVAVVLAPSEKIAFSISRQPAVESRVDTAGERRARQRPDRERTGAVESARGQPKTRIARSLEGVGERVESGATVDCGVKPGRLRGRRCGGRWSEDCRDSPFRRRPRAVSCAIGGPVVGDEVISEEEMPVLRAVRAVESRLDVGFGHGVRPFSSRPAKGSRQRDHCGVTTCVSAVARYASARRA